MKPALIRTEALCEAHGLRLPILLAPMAGACPAGEVAAKWWEKARQRRG